MSELRDFLRAIGGLLYGMAVLLAVGVVVSALWIALRWMATTG
jgi:hypothetical protein